MHNDKSQLRFAKLVIRSSLFALAFWVITIVHAVLSMFTFGMPFNWRYYFITRWSVMVVWLAKQVCGIDYKIEGLENLPKQEAAIIFCKHQSTWETLALQTFLPPLTFVLKRELLWVPFFGWALALLEPIAINRKAGSKAIKQIIKQGKRCLAKKRWVVIFPEGTRIAPRRQHRFAKGGSLFAAQAGVSVIPIAHNAGSFWPRRGFVKQPGQIVVKIGPAIITLGKSPEQINQEAKEWIDNTMQDIEK
ncbi:MAG: 1-acyl-sn-glycerol-3-phosphate acyltransferase [Gammaproteobacteria bacterium]